MKMLEEYDKSKGTDNKANTKSIHKSKSRGLNEAELFSINDMISLGMQYIQDKIYIVRGCEPLQSSSL